MNEKYSDLFIRYINNECTATELDEVLKVLQAGLYLDEWNSAINISEKVTTRSDEMDDGLSASDIDRIYLGIAQRIGSEVYETPPAKESNKILFPNWRRVAAIAATLVFAAGLYLFKSKNNLAHQDANLNAVKIVPGGDKAYLTVDSGKPISLTDAKEGVILQQDSVSITKTAAGKLVYQKRGAVGVAEHLNTITTPVGGKWQVQLPDGTEIWLNAASSISYPSSFKGHQTRLVKLTGEAYFEVAKDKAHPFIVETMSQKVKVLGTHFNIKSYSDDESTKTTLTEGNVGVEANGRRALLKPGEQSVLSEKQLSVHLVDTESELAWKNGDFSFRGEAIKEIMRNISRWYNIEVQYRGPVTDEEFQGRISRQKSIKEVLEILELTNAVHFKIEGRTVIVMK